MGSLKRRLGRLKRSEAGVRAVWEYAGLLALWWGLHVATGDQVWWVALLSLFAPYLFAPLLVLAPLGLLNPRRRYWGAVLVAVSLFAFEYGAPITVWATAQVETAERPEPTDELSILTFNVWGYSDSSETARAIISQGTPDVVVLQELSPYLVPALVEELGVLYPYRLLEPGEGPLGGGVLSRYPLRYARLPAGSPLGAFAQVVEVEAGERAFTLYNVHLEATGALAYLQSGGPVGRAVRASYERRERQVAQLIEDLARRQGPVIVAGDMNMTDQTDAYRALAGLLEDAQREAGRGFGHTFPAYGGRFGGLPIFPRMVRIDMLFHSDAWAALECRVVSEHGQSDHLPVLARLAWAQ
jgi:endonuclease/exonuclease/phosphatase (EEP) superfamily protein YafD